jgi:hypothetical protein
MLERSNPATPGGRIPISRSAVTGGEWINPEFGRIEFKEYATLWLAQRTDSRPRTREYYAWLIKKKPSPTSGIGRSPR